MPFKVLTIPDFKLMLNSLEAQVDLPVPVQVIDIRDQASFEAGHIEDAQNVGEHNIDGFIAQADMDSPLVICCYSGMMSQNAANYFCEQGFDSVYSLEGGYTAWQAQGEN